MNSYEVEQKMSSINVALFQKVEKYELENRLAKITDAMDVLEVSIREIRAENDGLRFRVQALEEGRVGSQ